MTPRLLIVVPVDESAELRFQAGSAEEELELRRWLQQPATVVTLLEAVTLLLEDLDEEAA